MKGRKFANAFVLFVALLSSLLCGLSCGVELQGDSLIQLSSAPSSKSDQADSSKMRKAEFGGPDDLKEIKQETFVPFPQGMPADTVVDDSPATSDPGDMAAKLADANDKANNK